MDTSSRLALSYVMPSQAQKHVTVNETFRNLDALVHLTATADDVTQQPTAPQENDAYILPNGKTGSAWDNMQDGSIAIIQDGAWMEYPAKTGMRAFVQGKDELQLFDGTNWRAASAAAAPPAYINDLLDVTIAAVQDKNILSYDGAANEWINSDELHRLSLFGLGSDADANNPFTAKINNALWTALESTNGGTGDLRYVMNKETDGNVLSILFQSNYVAKGEIGMVGDNDIVFKNSVDGSNFIETLRLTGNGDIKTKFGTLVQSTTTPASYLVSEADGTIKEISPDQVGLTGAEAYANLLRADLIANGGVKGGNPALTTQIVVGGITSGVLQIASADNGNEVTIYDSGTDFQAKNVRDRVFMSKGQVSLFTAIPAGAVITSTKGVCAMFGDSATWQRATMSPTTEGLAGTQFFFNAFRLSANGAGHVYVTAGAIPADVQLLSGDGTSIIDTVSLAPFQAATLFTDAVAEFQIVASKPITAAVASNNGESDFRVLPPLATELIGHSRLAKVSALYDGTIVDWYKQDGTAGQFTIPAGAPFNLHTAIGGGGNYAKGDFVILKSNAPISCFSGADGAGSDAESFYPLSTLGQRIPVPMAIENNGYAPRHACLAVASPYKGTAKIYDHNDQLVTTLTLDRTGTDQNHPCSSLFGQLASDVIQSADYYGGYIEADVPIYVVQNSRGNENLITGGFPTNGKEAALIGITPEDIRMELTRDTDGNLRKRVIDGTGVESWDLV